ncbi:MAG: 1-acyl-sn-glycerol-3-phosphate acyltransferase [Armatimonadetes bacterium]|jgi:1-acyl-sn-glycerol-3-phosphate acyltransferase|nr:1-acyl-sn-glycerol-3-phosphate acyltransferase [Armatimonadota bacterium]
MIYRIVWLLCQVIFGVLFRRRVVGREYVPRTGSFIVASNHISSLDPPVVGTGFWRPAVYMAKEELFRNPLIGWFYRQLNAFPIKRGSADRAAVKHAFDQLQQGGGLVMFPEGTRSKTGELREPEIGVGMIAYRSGAPVIPAWISGTDRILPKQGRPGLGRIFVAYGPPLRFEAPEGAKPGRQEYEAAARRIMDAIAELRDQHSGTRH